MSKTLKKTLPMGHLRTLLTDSPTINEENRTVELTWSTGFKGLRSGWDGSYYEELSMDPKHVDMSRLQTGAPLLASHDSQDLNSVIGVVERAWLEGTEGKALVRFSSDPEADKIFQKVKEKILRNVSVGYQVRKYEDVSKKEDTVPTYRATSWQPHEISIVPIGFDPNAQVRSNEINSEVEIEIQETQNTEAVQDSKPVAPQADDAQPKERKMTEAEKLALEVAAKKQAAQEEKQRQSEIRLAVRSAKLEDTFADDLCNQDISADQARKLVLEKMASAQPAPVTSTVRVEVSNDNQNSRRAALEESLLNRMDSRNFKVTDASRELYGKGMLRQIETVLPRHTMETDSQYAKRAMSSSDLPLALANIAEKGLQKQYDLQPRTFEQWSRKDTLRNYKEFSQVKSGDFASLIEKPEGAEIKEGSFGEKNETVKLADFAIQHAFTSQMLVNDDLSVLARMTSGGGIAASRLENKKAYEALTTNKIMKDGIALYHASHGNLGAASAINQGSVAEAYKLMRKQSSTDGLDKLNLAPSIFVCGPDKEAEARQFFSAVNAQQTSNVNIYSGSMVVVVDAEISGNQYYFMCNPNVIDTIVCYRLEGQEQPSVQTQMDFATSSMKLKVEHAFAAAPMDWRGIVKNAGA